MKNNFGKIICACLAILLVFCAVPFLNIAGVKAESLTLSSLLKDYAEGTEKNQEITSELGFVSDFGDKDGSPKKDNWTIPSFSAKAITEVGVADLTSSDNIGYTTAGDISFNDVGTDGTEGNKYGLFFMLKTSGIAGIDSPEIKIPAHALYVLTFNVKIGKCEKNHGLNASIIDQDGTIYAKKGITKTDGYETYCFLIEGNQFEEKSFKLRLMYGLYKEENAKTTSNEEKGYAVVDTVRVFSVSREQFDSLSTDTNKTTSVWLSKINKSYVKIENGTFNITNNKNWKIENNTALSDLAPTSWNQTGDSNSTYGIVNTKSSVFSDRMAQLGLSFSNPENGETNNNVLMLYNKDYSAQTLTSSSIKLSSNYVYEISFRFNTPATENETNGISFYIIDDNNKTIYSKENVFSYETYSDNANEWATFRVFIKTISSMSNVKFVIKFGNETTKTLGVAYVDDVSISDKRSTDSAFVNHDENKFELTKEEGDEETKYLEKGTVTFEDLQKLDLSKQSNRTMFVYEYVKEETNTNTNTDTTTDDEETTDDEDSSNNAIIWYVVPSVLFGGCLIAGIIIFYCKKIKIKKHPRVKKAKYDRKKTLNKQVARREKEAEKRERKIEKNERKSNKQENAIILEAENPNVKDIETENLETENLEEEELKTENLSEEN